MELNTAPASGGQTATQNPQTAPTQTVGASTQSGGVQPGTSTNLLQPIGVNLNSPALTKVSLPAGIQAQTAASVQPAAKPARHDVNLALFIIPVALCLVAVVMFWAMRRSAKSTTD